MGLTALYTLALFVYMLQCALCMYQPARVKEDVVRDVITSPCPVGCQCTNENNTAECSFSFSTFSLSNVMPWQLTKLQVHGNDKTWKSEWLSGSVKIVLQAGLDGFKNKREIIQTTLLQLSHLDISYIPIYAVLNSDFSTLENLKYLKLAYNNVSDIQPKAFKNLYQLETLDLAGNKITKLENNLFEDLVGLRTLNLGSNSLSVIRDTQLKGLDNLEHLDLQSNMMRQVETFLPVMNLSVLQTVDLRDNRIEYMLNETVERLAELKSVDLSDNPFECTCALSGLIKLYRSNPVLFNGDVRCGRYSDYAGVSLKQLDENSLPCEGAKIVKISPEVDVLYQASVVLDCAASGDRPLAIYWKTPWGEVFSRQSNKRLYPDEFQGFSSNESYYAMNLFLTTEIYVSGNGSLMIDKFRGHFSGKFTCFAKSLIASSNSSVMVDIHTTIWNHYIISLVIGAGSMSVMLLIALITGITRIIANKCLNSASCCKTEAEEKGMEVVHKMVASNGNVAVTYAVTETDTIEYMDDELIPISPDPPVNSPMYRLSPEKCTTPKEEEEPLDLRKEGEESRQAIWDQLVEVRTRLRSGAGRKMKKVQSHVRSITDTGSLKIKNIKDASSIKLQSFKESATASASAMKKNVASGMVQVKHSVQSIKDFCGTSDLGPGTVSMVSLSTDVDTKETVKVVRSHTFV